MQFPHSLLWKRAAVISFVLVTNLSLAAKAQSEPVIQSIEQLYNGRNYSQALILIEQNLRSLPGSGLLHYLKGNVLVATGQTPSAVAEYQRQVNNNAARSNADLQASAQEKAAAAANAAEGLQSQMYAQVRPGEAAINTANTSLFVRNYSVSEPATRQPSKAP